MSNTVVCLGPAEPDVNQLFEMFKQSLSTYTSKNKKRLQAVLRCWGNHPKPELLTFAQKFASYDMQVSVRDSPVIRLWNQQCDMQNPLLKIVLARLHKKYFINERYVMNIFGEIDYQFGKINAKPSSSLPVYALVLFKRFNYTWPEIWNRFGKRRLRSMKRWFELIQADVVGTNIAEISQKAKTFTKILGIQNVMFAMCVFQASKMLHGADCLKFSPLVMGSVMFNDYNRQQARENYCLLEIAFLKQINWDLHVNATVYRAQVAILMWTDFNTVNADMTKFDHATEQGLAILQMLYEAAEVPDTPLSEHPREIFLGSLGRSFVQNWDNEEKKSLARVWASYNGRAVSAPLIWDAELKNKPKAWAVLQSPW